MSDYTIPEKDKKFEAEAHKRGYWLVPQDTYNHAVLLTQSPCKVIVGEVKDEFSMKRGDMLRMAVQGPYVGLSIYPAFKRPLPETKTAIGQIADKVLGVLVPKPSKS